ncbi:MAG: HD domain-containing protein [Bacteroidia bacterium]|nr:HD domain-containing protein [Bacteroidia bacterium]
MKILEAIKAPIFGVLAEQSEQLGLPAYVIGGYVRDHFLKRNSKDVDIVVEGRGIELARAFARVSRCRDVVVYENYGTAMVRHPDMEVEFVGARKESYQRNSRKPLVESGSLHDDQLRRDFSINAMSISLNKENYGELIDPFGGIDDLEKKIIRTPTDPNVTFSDDPLRMMRAIRFATQLGFFIEEQTFQAIKRNRKRIEIISKERIKDELNKIILSQTPSRGFILLDKCGLLDLIFPELAAMKGVDYVDGRGHKDNFYHTLKVLDNISEKNNDLWIRWVAILHDIAKPLTKRYSPKGGWTFHGHEDRGARMVPKIFRRMKLPLNDRMNYVQKLVKLHQRPIALVNEEVTDSAIRRIVVDAGDDLNDLLDFCRADITSKNENKVKRFLRNYTELEKRIHEVEERDNLRNWQPPVGGDLIMKTFNIKPGRIVGQIKNDIREAILDGVIPNDKEAAIAYMKEIAPKYIEENP